MKIETQCGRWQLWPGALVLWQQILLDKGYCLCKLYSVAPVYKDTEDGLFGIFLGGNFLND